MPKPRKKSNSKKNKFDEDHDISKKFDEMEEILLQLKLKEQKDKDKESSTFSKYKDMEKT